MLFAWRDVNKVILPDIVGLAADKDLPFSFHYKIPFMDFFVVVEPCVTQVHKGNADFFGREFPYLFAINKDLFCILTDLSK